VKLTKIRAAALVNGFRVCENQSASPIGILGILHLAFQQRVTANIAGQKFWQIAVVAAAGAIGCVSRADAAYYYWQDSDPTYYRPVPTMPSHRPVERRPVKKDVVAQKETGAKPQGALIIAVSLNKQQLKLYDANGFFAEAPVSTGMKGHGTPMGVFSVIQKHKWHHSNIYSGAPMPYMQRITWSGVALHAGVLPGYPASHGCIRMPEAFAIKMWNWTRMGARVLVTPGEISPASFTHPLLPSIKVQPQVSADAATDAPLATKADKGAADKPDVVETKLELTPSVDHHDAASPDADAKTRTADASSKAPATLSDAAPTAPKEDVTVDLAANKPTADNATPKTEDAPAATPKVGMTASDANSAVKPAEPSKAGDAAAQKPAAKADAAPDARKDDTRLPDAAKAAAAKTEAAKRAGQIAVFISRKDSKLYVRQNLAPLFDSPVTIAPSDRPLGTHVFTADIDRNDPNVVHWSVVSLPVSARGLVHEDEPRGAVRRKGAKPEPVTAKPAIDSPAEALNRITIPADVMARITDALTTGASIIVSDQGINQGETGEGTDFIVSLR
jgi:lipoprotein-anchoring transpeptidase ErfK/SrfK